jgi:glycosyltransferase involved in cell wall biosynthesis
MGESRVESSGRVSVLLPVYNASLYLEESLGSLAGQTLDDFEIVAIDDGSVDGSSRILERWSQRDFRLRVLRQQHLGLVPALNRGLALCRGDLIARMDADDISHPDRLALQRRVLMERSEIDVVASLVTHFSTGSVGEGLRVYESWLNNLVEDAEIRRDLFVESPLPHPSVMVRRSALAAIGGYRDRGWPEDYDAWLRLAREGHRFTKIPQVLLLWRDRPDRLSRVDGRYAIERFLECKAHHLVRGPLMGRQRVLLWGAGKTGRRLSKHLLRRRVPLEGFIDIDPKKWGRTVRGLPVFRPEALPEWIANDARSWILLAAVSSRGARARIREHLTASGWKEAQDFWCVA